MKAKALPPETLARLREQFGHEADVAALLAAYERSHRLLERSLWEFGSELRGEIETFLNEEPLLPRR